MKKLLLILASLLAVNTFATETNVALVKSKSTADCAQEVHFTNPSNTYSGVITGEVADVEVRNHTNTYQQAYDWGNHANGGYFKTNGTVAGNRSVWGSDLLLADIDVTAIGAVKRGIRFPGATQSIGVNSIAAEQSLVLSGGGVATIVNSPGSKQIGAVNAFARMVIDTYAYGAIQLGILSEQTYATNSGGSGSIQLLYNDVTGQCSLMTGKASLSLGANTNTHDHAIVAGDGQVSHGDGSVTAGGGFYGPGSNITGITVLDTPVSTGVLYVDGGRTDAYVENGTVTRPYKTIAAAESNANHVTTIWLIRKSAHYSEPGLVISNACNIEGQGAPVIDGPVTFRGNSKTVSSVQFAGNVVCSNIFISFTGGEITGTIFVGSTNASHAVRLDGTYVHSAVGPAVVVSGAAGLSLNDANCTAIGDMASSALNCTGTGIISIVNSLVMNMAAAPAIYLAGGQLVGSQNLVYNLGYGAPFYGSAISATNALAAAPNMVSDTTCMGGLVFGNSLTVVDGATLVIPGTTISGSLVSYRPASRLSNDSTVNGGVGTIKDALDTLNNPPTVATTASLPFVAATSTNIGIPIVGNLSWGKLYSSDSNTFSKTLTLTLYASNDYKGSNAYWRANMNLVTVPVTNTVIAGTNVAMVADATGISTNDLVYFTDNGEFARVASVSGTALTFEDMTLAAHSTTGSISRVAEFGGFGMIDLTQTSNVWTRITSPTAITQTLKLDYLYRR